MNEINVDINSEASLITGPKKKKKDPHFESYFIVTYFLLIMNIHSFNRPEEKKKSAQDV